MKKEKSFSEKLKNWNMLTYNVKRQKQNKNCIYQGFSQGDIMEFPPPPRDSVDP